jgi:hypothetical protein
MRLEATLVSCLFDETGKLTREEALRRAAKEIAREERAKPKPPPNPQSFNPQAGSFASLREVMKTRLMKLVESIEREEAAREAPEGAPHTAATTTHALAPACNPESTKTPRVPKIAAPSPEPPPPNNVVLIFAGGPTGATRIDHEFPAHPVTAAWRASLEQNANCADVRPHVRRGLGERHQKPRAEDRR